MSNDPLSKVLTRSGNAQEVLETGNLLKLQAMPWKEVSRPIQISCELYPEAVIRVVYDSFSEATKSALRLKKIPCEEDPGMCRLTLNGEALDTIIQSRNLAPRLKEPITEVDIPIEPLPPSWSVKMMRTLGFKSKGM